MLFLFCFLSVSLRKTVILIPGHGGGGAWATITQPELYPECPPLNNFQFWPYNDTFSTQYKKCMGHLIRAVYNPSTNQIEHPPGIDFRPEEWGQMESLYNYADLVKYLVNKGYKKGEDLFGIPYDWVLYYPGTADLFKRLKSFVEEQHSKSGNKVILMGHSMGTHVVRMLLNYTSDEWFKEHIDGIELLAPAFFGCFVSFNMVVQGKFGAIPENAIAAKSARQMPSLHLLWDNYVVFDNHSVFQNVPNKPEGIKPNEVKDYLVSIGRFDEDAQKIFEFVEPSLQQAPREPPVRTYILYNSGISTPISLDASNIFSFINESGDGICHDGGPKYVCTHWKNVKCFDWKKDDRDYGHSTMMYRSSSLERIYDFIGNDSQPSKTTDYKLVIIVVSICCVVIIASVIATIVVIRKRNNSHSKEEKNTGVLNQKLLESND